MADYTPPGQVTTRSQFEDEFEKISLALATKLDKDQDDALNGTLDANSQRIINLPAPTTNTEPVRVYDLLFGDWSDLLGLNAQTTSFDDSEVSYTAPNVQFALEAEDSLRVSLENRVTAAEGNLVANNLTLSGLTGDVTDLQTWQTAYQSIILGNVADIGSLSSSKADRDQDAVAGNIAVFDSNGNPVDYGQTPVEVAGSTTWGLITGTLSDQTDLQAALDGKANTSHTHVKADITDFDEADYATAAQGALANTALQSGDNISLLSNDSGFISGITSSDVTTALGYTPQDAATAFSGAYNDLSGIPTSYPATIITYDNTTSGLPEVDVQGAVDDLHSRVTDIEDMGDFRDFGVGGVGGDPVFDANTYIVPGTYRAASANTTNVPVSGTGTLQVLRSYNVIQQIYRISSSEYFRISTDTGATWGSWSNQSSLAYGIGLDTGISVTDANADLQNGFYAGSGGSGVNFPGDTQDSPFMAFSRGTRQSSLHLGTSPDGLEAYLRTGDSGAWEEAEVLHTGNITDARGYIVVGDYSGVTDAMQAAESTGTPLLLVEDTTINIPADASTLQNALDYTSTVSSSVAVTINFETGHQPTSGASVDGRDLSNYTITATAGTVTAGGAFSSWLAGTYTTFPTVSCILDSDNLVDIGIHLVNASKIRVTSGSGCINSADYNLQMRSSRADIEGGVFDGAGAVGVRVTQASQLKAQSSTANNCGNIGYDISRGSTANVMLATATGCGFDTGTITGDPNFINQGGLVVRRSLVAADYFDASGSTRGIAIQLSAHVNASLAVLDNCTITGARVSSMSRLALGGASLQNCVTGLSAGPSSNVDATGADFSGSTTTWSVFGSGAVVDLTGSVGSAGGSGAILNSPSSSGTVWNDDQPNLVQHDSLYSHQFTIPNDTAVSFPVLGDGGGRGVLLAIATGSSTQNGLVYCRVTNANSAVLAGGLTLAATTGVLSGTTGTSGNLTISPHSDGNIYVENRGGGSVDVGITVLSQNIA